MNNAIIFIYITILSLKYIKCYLIKAELYYIILLDFKHKAQKGIKILMSDPEVK